MVDQDILFDKHPPEQPEIRKYFWALDTGARL